ncbi:class I SAM-dependent methyltransferase [Tardiphaga sp. 37S4]|uniref:class I SAM-dependent methyltransferase n=1 Tax=Tardiphaga sp. 37S4 TaxID=1404741 RepID=UPI001E40D688|nr:class I SAM-dependent methyltransferase [Tardiphaga sp. 37S4]UFS77218.1 class I SAM-dependent methyltransferase [Tardiphaga sp. 37S4]
MTYSPAKRSTVTIDAPKADLSGLPSRYVHPGELDILIHLIRSVDAHTVVEFGCNNGRTAAAVLRNVPGMERYVGVDVPPGYNFTCKVQAKEIPPAPGELASADERFELLLRDRGTFDLDADDLPACDVVFVDADHSRAAVLNDRELAKAIVRPGGMIVYHDDNGLEVVDVSKALDDLAARGANIVHIAGTWLAFERV